ncbi:type I restriction-modification enzyme R subunit C-terminal domain-containing protein [Synechocystis sp. CACIAM 05]|uniref:type I restriction-modification enzyme R subunit C-terminal domain-containing protein n=1 Tax=Synechocystis sp. CACIAM 05 TaxID=1933929 RepID=UPI00138E77D8|nr:type I restriction-modification enzyme R subunit C-terminal domain-containing protein [Synechocystis sp. CACIAM 05]QHU98938.1 restriction endonuclease subunit R [Synechocystis sp. CACIAM 05]
MFFTSQQASEITGCTLRQLQYWREKGVVSPAVDATGRGRSVYYSQADLFELMVMKHLLNAGLEYTQAVDVLFGLRHKEPSFTDAPQHSRYLVTRYPEHKMLVIEPFSLDTVQEAMYGGQLVVPLWLDEIHLKLGQKLQQTPGTDMPNTSPLPRSNEDETRRIIDQKLEMSGWEVVSMKPGLGTEKLSRHAVREYPLATGDADYALFVNGLFLGVLEAKKVSINSQSALEQSKRYSRATFDGVGNWRGYRVPFLYSSNGELIYFLDVREKTNICRQLQAFHSPQTLLDMLARDEGRSNAWLKEHPIEHNTRLRPYQVGAIAAIEEAIAVGKRELLVAMATGTGKTFTIVSSLYRLLASKRVQRVLFLVDRKALAAQTVTALRAFDTPNNNKFNQEYEVYSQAFKKGDFGDEGSFDAQLLPNRYLTDPSDIHTFVYVCTIQRMKINLFGQETPEGEEETGEREVEADAEQLDIPIHAFDLIVADECHRGYTAQEVGTWRRVLEYFDAIKIGLTATPATHTVSLFKNLVYRYSTEQAINDGYLVDYEQVNIDSNVRINGTFLHQGEVVGVIDPESGAKSYEQLEDEREFATTDIERKITSPDSNRKIVEEIARYAQQHEEETGRFPKILIFAANDLNHTSHADHLVTICKEVFGQGDDFVQKITGKVDDPLKKIREFRNRPEPKIAVTVDLLTTGVDIPQIEFVVFLRPVRSRILWVQMLGRGTRLCPDIAKTHFKIFDCFGGSLVDYFNEATDFTLDPPRQQAMPISRVISNIIDDIDTEHHLNIFTRRLRRLDRSITPEGREQLDTFIAGSSEEGMAQSWLHLFETSPKAARGLLQDSEFQHFLDQYPRVKQGFWVAEGVEDTVTSRVVINGQKPEDYLDSFHRFLEEQEGQIEALQILRNSPDHWSGQALEDLRRKLKENRFNEQNLQRAYQLVHNKALADIISLIRWAYEDTQEVYTAQERVDRAIGTVTRDMDLTAEQEAWLGYIREHLVQNLSIDMDDFDYAPVFERHGGRGRANKVFAGKLTKLVQGLNSAIAA